MRAMYRIERARAAAATLEVIGFAMLLAITLTLPFAHPARAVTEDVYAVDYEFLPKTITIDVGDTVRWTSNVSTPHTVTSDTGAWTPISLNGVGSTGSHTFTAAGTYNYHCSFHQSLGMTGTVIVSGATVPEFSSGVVVVAGMMIMMLGLMFVRRARK